MNLEIKRVPDVVFKTRVRDESVEGPNPYRWQDKTTADIFGGKNIPYLNKEMLVKELMTAVTIGELSQVTTLITSGAQAQNIAKDLESTMKSGETGTTKPSDPAETTKKTSQTTATTTPTAAEKQSPGSESPAAKAPPKEQTTKNRMKKAQMALAKLNNAEEVMSILQKAGVFN
jgi:hypothetical protein